MLIWHIIVVFMPLQFRAMDFLFRQRKALSRFNKHLAMGWPDMLTRWRSEYRTDFDDYVRMVSPGLTPREKEEFWKSPDK